MKKRLHALVLIILPLCVNAQTVINDAEQSFSYISSTLDTFESTGRLVNNPGIDGSDLEAYLDLLRYYYDEFSRDFNRDSSMCDFYRDPENNGMTIEEKAEISFSFLSDLDDRVDHYIVTNDSFQNELAEEFGTFLLDNVADLKAGSKANHGLPASVVDEAGMISFIDSACT